MPVGDAPAAWPAAAIEMVCRALAEACTGPQIPNLVAGLRADPGPDGETKWKRLFNAVVEAQNRQGDGRPLLRLVLDVMLPVRFASPELFEQHRISVNTRLLLYGLQVRPDGRLGRVPTATTLSEARQRADDLHDELERRQVHSDVLRFCRAELLQDNYFHAVLEAAKSVADKLRALTGLQGDGSGLVDAACSLTNGPRVAFNGLTTDWERSEHTGIATLLKGMFSTFRNPTAHAPRILWATSRSEALDMLTLASMLHRRLDAATVTAVPGGS
jgi:uncharacterized protein (TIGR02391 family)